MGERVLVVDDEIDIAKVLELNLSAEGFEVAVANSAQEALDAALTFRPDLVLLDINMPGMDGLQVTRALRSDALTASTSIILVTAKASVDDRLIGLAAGADDYVTKPFDVDELLSRVRAALRRSHQLRGMSPLTGLPGNFEILRQLNSFLQEDGVSFALIHADLDHFKFYNDKYGFVQGDEAIKATAELLLDELGRISTRAATTSPSSCPRTWPPTWPHGSLPASTPWPLRCMTLRTGSRAPSPSSAAMGCDASSPSSPSRWGSPAPAPGGSRPRWRWPRWPAR
jgi:DNA-binding response OmpR family regulator